MAQLKTVRMKNSEAVTIYNGLPLLGGLKGPKFTYAVARTKSNLTKVIEALTESLESPEDYKEYEKLRTELCEKHAEKDDTNSAIIKAGKYVLQDNEAFDKDLEALKEEHKAAVDAREEQVKGYEELLKEETSFKYYVVKQENLPQEISQAQMDVIIQFVEEEK